MTRVSYPWYQTLKQRTGFVLSTSVWVHIHDISQLRGDSTITEADSPHSKTTLCRFLYSVPELSDNPIKLGQSDSYMRCQPGVSLLQKRRQAIIWTNAGILSIGPFRTNFSEILIEIYTFSLMKMHWKISSAKSRPFCLGLNMLTKLLSIEWKIRVQHFSWYFLLYMMTSSNGNFFRVTGPLCGKFTGHRWIPCTKASYAELWCFLWSAPE